jgi:hypothetical protein
VLYDAGRLGAENLLEVTAYTLVLDGRFLRYWDELEDALVQLSVARGILDELAESAETSRDHALNTLDLPLTQPGRVVLSPKGSAPADGGSAWDEFIAGDGGVQDLLQRFTLDAAALFLWGHALNTLDLSLTQPGRVVLGPKGSAPADGGSEWDEFTNAFKTVRLRSRFRSSWTGSSTS